MHIFLFSSSFLVAILVAKLFHVILWVPWKIQGHFERQGIMGPPYRPIYGNTREIKRMYAEVQSKPVPHPTENGPLNHDICHRVMPFYYNWSARYGKTFLYWFGPNPMLAIADPDMIKEVLSNPSGSFKKLKHNPLAKMLFGCGLVGLDGEKWSRRRRIANLAFNMEQVKGWVPEIVASVSKTLTRWESMRMGREEFEVEVNHELHILSADIISVTAFGSSFEEGKRIFELQDRQMHLVSLALRSIYIPGFRFLPTKRNLERRMLDNETRKAIGSLIQKNNSTNNSTSLLNLFMTNIDESDKNKTSLTMDEVIDECKTFYFAGKETTANLLTWALVLLSAHQEWQDKAREEVLQICGANGLPTSQNITDFKLVNMILNETMRLYPPAVMLKRRTTVDVKVKELLIPAETQLYLAMTVVHHDVEIWGDDANTFNPMRFSEPRKHLASFFPFSLGPRVCVGQNLALVESKIVLAMIVQRFTFRLSPSYVHAPMQLMTLQPQFGAHILFRRVS
ncbi:hypothetical protein vseg_017957 [Gypsophila vaccaria]